MRMWMVDPKLLCRQHLLGEHKEIHMIVGCLRKGRSIRGYVQKKLIDVGEIQNRHFVLVEELKRRGYKHNSKIGEYERPFGHHCNIDIDIEKNLKELHRRCEKCREKQDNFFNKNRVGQLFRIRNLPDIGEPLRNKLGVIVESVFQHQNTPWKMLVFNKPFPCDDGYWTLKTEFFDFIGD